MRFKTIAVHAGQEPEEKTGAVIPPIYQTSTYAQGASVGPLDYEYTRAGNPNFTHLECALAALEGGTEGVVFSSGLGATTALMMQLTSGDHIVAVTDLYGGTYRLLAKLSQQFGITSSFVAGNEVRAWEQAITAKTRYLWLETPSNPLLNIVDIAAIAKLGKRRGVTVIVDNTFASPALQQPLSLGADVVLHSTTKYIGGHSDVVGGAIVTHDAKLAAAVRHARMAFGLNPSPFDVWLTQRGLKTLSLRMEQHCCGAAAIAAFLAGHAKVERVFYPGLADHPGHALAKKQMSGFGGMVSAVLKVKPRGLKSVLTRGRFFRLAESLGGVESLVSHPASMTHASVPANVRAQRGIVDTLVRFSIGIEDPDDLVDDLHELLKKMS